MNRRSLLTVEHTLYLVLLALALALRMYNLDAHPLNDAEAREALAVFRFVNARPGAALPHSPAYFFFTYFGFLLFDASNAAARLAPALFGAALVFLPMFFRDHLGRAGALLAGVGLAFSSGLLAASRSADGSVIALFALGLSVGALRRYLVTSATGWLVAGAVALGVGLASGAAFLTGLLILSVTALIMLWLNPEEREAWREAWAGVRAQSLIFFAALGAALFGAATVGLIYLSGLGALAGSASAWLAGFAPSAAGRAPTTLLLFLPVYEPLPLVFGIVGAVLAFRRGNRLGQWLFWFFLAAQAFAVLYGGRTLFDVIWIAAPLAALAGWAVADVVRSEWAREEWPMAAVQVGVIAGLLALAALNLAQFAERARANPNVLQERFTFSGLTLDAPASAHVYVALIAIGLTLVVSYLLGMGWSPRAAWVGLTVSASAALFVMTVSAGWGLTQLRPDSPVELWQARPVAGDLNRLMTTLGDVSNYSVGNTHDIQVTVQAPPDGALGWALRDFSHAEFVDSLDPLINSPAVIAPAEQVNPTLGSAYVGAGFVLRSTWNASNLSWPQQLVWLAYRRTPGPPQTENVILWVRQDVAQLKDASPAP
jgi:hypothetical protein